MVFQTFVFPVSIIFGATRMNLTHWRTLVWVLYDEVACFVTEFGGIINFLPFHQRHCKPLEMTNETTKPFVRPVEIDLLLSCFRPFL